MPRDKSRSRYRRSSSEGSDSYERKKSKSKHKRRSRDRQDSTCKRKRSTSRSGHRRRSYSRSISRDRYEFKSSSKSRSKKSYKRSESRECSNSRSTSKYSKSKHKSSRRSASSISRSSSDIERPTVTTKVYLDDTETKVEKAIKAAAAVGLTMTKLPTYELKSVDVKEDMPTIQDRNLLAELNTDTFVPKSYTSSKSKKFSQNIIIDLDTDTVKVSEPATLKDDSILNFSEIPSEEELREMWIKKLYNFRKKMLKGEL